MTCLNNILEARYFKTAIPKIEYFRTNKEIHFSALCKDDANGNVPLGKSCNRYWACQGGYPRLQRCPAMLVFDKQRKRCVAPPTTDCDIPPTPPPSEDDEDNNNDGGNRPFRYKILTYSNF